tara:strand:+ start:206 stop:649 length:444 start_codon:yes stop_codon:yes gene_type:complete
MGCTDCHAINYNFDANEDDSSCVLLNTNRLGEYAVTDSIMDFTLDWNIDNYTILIARDSCDSVGIIISNYSNIINSTGALTVKAKIKGDSIFIPQHIIDNGSDGYNDYIEVYESKGYFQSDSIYFNLYYMNRYDPFYGFVKGYLISS